MLCVEADSWNKKSPPKPDCCPWLCVGNVFEVPKLRPPSPKSLPTETFKRVFILCYKKHTAVKQTCCVATGAENKSTGGAVTTGAEIPKLATAGAIAVAVETGCAEKEGKAIPEYFDGAVTVLVAGTGSAPVACSAKNACNGRLSFHFPSSYFCLRKCANAAPSYTLYFSECCSSCMVFLRNTLGCGLENSAGRCAR